MTHAKKKSLALLKAMPKNHNKKSLVGLHYKNASCVMIDLCAITEHEARANDTSYIKKNSTARVDYYEKMTKLRKVQKHLARCFCTTYFP